MPVENSKGPGGSEPNLAAATVGQIVKLGIVSDGAGGSSGVVSDSSGQQMPYDLVGSFSLGASTAPATIASTDLSCGYIELNANTIVAFSTNADGSYMQKDFTVQQNSLGGYVSIFPDNITWAGGVAPQPPLMASNFVRYTFTSADGGVTWLGFTENAPLAPLALDRFNRANDALLLGTSEIGGAWSALAGTWGISGNSAYLAARVGDSVAALEVGNVNHTVFVDVTPGNSLGQPALLGRVVDAANYWLLLPGQQGSSPQTLSIWKKVAGVFTNLATYNLPAGQAYVIGQPSRIGLKFSGNVVTAYINGVTLGSVTDAALNTATKIGLRYNDANTGSTWDNLVTIA